MRTRRTPQLLLSTASRPQIPFPNRTEHLDTFGPTLRVHSDLHALVVSRSEHLGGDVVHVAFSVDERDRRQEGAEPVDFRSRRSACDRLEPIAVGREDAIDVVRVHLGAIGLILDFVSDMRFVERGRRGRRWPSANVVGNWDARFVATVDVLNEALNQTRLDATEDLAGRLVDPRGVGDSDGALENRNALRVLVENGIDVLRLPK